MAERRLDPLLLLCIAVLTFFAVFAYGLASAASERWFDFGVAGLFFIWLVAAGLEHRMPRWPLVPTVALMVLLLLGWLSVWNAHYTHDWETGFESREHLPWLFGSADRATSLEKMIHFSTMVTGFLVVADLAHSRRNRRSVLSIVALAGFAVALVGLWQKASGTQQMLFFDEHLTERRFFAAYRYHGNAATLLNFAWPIAAVLLLRAVVKQEGGARVALWGAATIFTLAAVFVNTSKMGQVLGLLMVPTMLLVYRRTIARIIRRHSQPRLILALIGLMVMGLVGCLIQLSLSTSIDRWADFGGSLAPRLETYRTALSIIPHGGWWGTGPGTFSTIYPYYVSAEGRTIDFFWQTAHQDYLQTIIEWGYVGAIAWGVLLGSIVFLGVRHAFSDKYFYAGAALIGVAAATVQAMIDFPAQIASLQWVAILLGSSFCFKVSVEKRLK